MYSAARCLRLFIIGTVNDDYGCHSANLFTFFVNYSLRVFLLDGVLKLEKLKLVVQLTGNYGYWLRLFDNFIQFQVECVIWVFMMLIYEERFAFMKFMAGQEDELGDMLLRP